MRVGACCRCERRGDGRGPVSGGHGVAQGATTGTRAQGLPDPFPMFTLVHTPAGGLVASQQARPPGVRAGAVLSVRSGVGSGSVIWKPRIAIPSGKCALCGPGPCASRHHCACRPCAGQTPPHGFVIAVSSLSVGAVCWAVGLQGDAKCCVVAVLTTGTGLQLAGEGCGAAAGGGSKAATEARAVIKGPDFFFVKDRP